MKSIIKNTAINSLSLYVLPLLISGVKIQDGISTLIIGGFILSIMFKVLKPLFNLISLPLNLVTLGLFSFFSNAIILYLLTVLIPQISITAFKFPGYSKFGFVVPEVYFNTLFAYVVSAGVLFLTVSFIHWIIKK